MQNNSRNTYCFWSVLYFIRYIFGFFKLITEEGVIKEKLG